MVVKYTFGLLFLSVFNIASAQESNSVVYERAQYIYTPQNKNKKSKSKRVAIPVVLNRKAELIYSSGYLLFESPQGTDTVSLPGINKTYWNYPFRKMFCISYNNRSDFTALLFCNRKNAKKFKKFMLKNGGHYKRGVFRIIFSVLLPFFPYFPTYNPSWYDLQQKCD